MKLSLEPWLVHTPWPARSTGGKERPLHTALRSKSHRNPEQAVLAGPTANGTGSGTSMYPAAPQASRPDLSSNSASKRDKYTQIAGVPASGSASQAPVGAALQGLLPATLQLVLPGPTLEVGPLSPEPQFRYPVDLTPVCCPLAVQFGPTKKRS